MHTPAYRLYYSYLSPFRICSYRPEMSRSDRVSVCSWQCYFKIFCQHFLSAKEFEVSCYVMHILYTTVSICSPKNYKAGALRPSGMFGTSSSTSGSHICLWSIWKIFQVRKLEYQCHSFKVWTSLSRTYPKGSCLNTASSFLILCRWKQFTKIASKGANVR